MLIEPEHCGSMNPEKVNAVLEYWLTHPFETYAQIAKACGIGEVSFWRYRQNPEFMDAYRKAQRDIFEGMVGGAMEQLHTKIVNGEWQAIKYVLDGNDFAAAQKIESNNSTINIKIEGDDSND